MKNPYLWQRSLRASLFLAIFPFLAAKIGTLVLLAFELSEQSFRLDPITAMAVVALAAGSVLDLWTIYNLTTTWHRLNRHPWVIVPDALVNLALAAVAMVPAPFALLLASLESVLGELSVVTWGIWVPLVLLLILACVQVVASLRLALRLQAQRVGRPVGR